MAIGVDCKAESSAMVYVNDPTPWFNRELEAEGATKAKEAEHSDVATAVVVKAACENLMVVLVPVSYVYNSLKEVRKM